MAKMDKTPNNRQNKFRQNMKESGRCQRSFFLTAEAMEAIYKHKEKIDAPSLNHALEHMLTSLLTMEVETEDKNLEDKAQVDRRNEIVEQAKRVSGAFRERESTSSMKENEKVWINESIKLALLIGPSKPILKEPLP